VSNHTLLDVSELRAGYFGRAVIDHISFRVEEPGVYVVLGPNGAGKTTLLRALAGILRPLAGRVEVCGQPAESIEARTHVGYLTHLDGIPEGMTVGDALRFYAKIEGVSEGEVASVVSRLSLESLIHRRFSQLSQGQKKRVSVARVFLKHKEVYLLDEPTANLDPKVAGEIRSIMLELSSKSAVLYSSHNLFEAREIGQYVLALKQGSLTLFGRIDELKVERYLIGVRTLGDPAPSGWIRREGDYYLYELVGPEDVPELVAKLIAQGVRIREVRELANPLEELFR